MKHKINKDHVLFTSPDGEYHLSLDEYKKLGHEKAEELAKSEIEKKANLDVYRGKTINFAQARELGFCEYGIEDFCDKLKIDKEGTYKITDLLEMLSVRVFKAYPSECMKLFGKSRLMDKFGGVKKFLSENKKEWAFDLVISNKFLDDKSLHLLACDIAYDCLPIFEKEYPNDDRPRKAIEAKQKWIEGKITVEELEAARKGARSAARSAAWSAESAADADAARSAARSAAWSAESAADADAARSAAWSAAWSAESAVWSVAYEEHCNKLIKYLNKGE